MVTLRLGVWLTALYVVLNHVIRCCVFNETSALFITLYLARYLGVLFKFPRFWVVQLANS